MSGERELETAELSTETLAGKALELRPYGNIGVAYTYNEPLISLSTFGTAPFFIQLTKTVLDFCRNDVSCFYSALEPQEICGFFCGQKNVQTRHYFWLFAPHHAAISPISSNGSGLL